MGPPIPEGPMAEVGRDPAQSGLGRHFPLGPMRLGLGETLRGAPALEIQSPKGAAAKGGGVPPKASGAPPTLGFPTLGAGGRPKGGIPAH